MACGASACEPVDAADPAVAVLRVPADRLQRRPPPSDTFGSQPVSRGQLLVADAQRHHLARAGAVAAFGRDDLRGRPARSRAPRRRGGSASTQSRHRDVLALAVDVDVAGRCPCAATVRWPRTPSVQKQKSRSGSSWPSSIVLALERLRDDRAGHVARVLARPVVVEHARDDAGHAERVVVVHRQEVGGDLRGRVDRLRVDRRALVQDQAARVVEVVVVRDGLARRCRTPPRCRRCRTSRARGRCRRSTGAG